MKTIELFKVVYVDALGEIQERDFTSENEARTFAATITDSLIYRHRMIGEIERLI